MNNSGSLLDIGYKESDGHYSVRIEVRPNEEIKSLQRRMKEIGERKRVQGVSPSEIVQLNEELDGLEERAQLYGNFCRNAVHVFSDHLWTEESRKGKTVYQIEARMPSAPESCSYNLEPSEKFPNALFLIPCNLMGKDALDGIIGKVLAKEKECYAMAEPPTAPQQESSPEDQPPESFGDLLVSFLSRATSALRRSR